MARQPRLTVPGYAHHIIQRGNNRQAIFGSDADYELLLDLLHENAHKQQVAIHSYVLMSNHFHLLATPETAEGIPQMRLWFTFGPGSPHEAFSRSLRLFIKEVMPALSPQPIWDPATAPTVGEVAA